MDERQKKVLSALQALCSKQECCSHDIRLKAGKKLDGDEAAVEEVLRSLLSDGFVDDLRYATAFARDKSSITGWGPLKIRFALSAKGIGRGIADEAIAATDREESVGKLSRLLAVKARTLEGDPQKRLKLIKFALSRGYLYEQVESALAEISKTA